jgi:GNAT superfamily N-acetyltransferase
MLALRDAWCYPRLMSAIIIRPCVSTDLSELVRLWHEQAVLQQQFDRRLQLHSDARARWLEAASGWLADAHCKLLVAVREADILGCIVGRLESASPGLMPETVGLIVEIVIDAHAHQGGLGSHLFDALRRWFDEQGVKQIIVRVPRRHPVQQAFWRAQGATEWMDILWIK